LPPSSSSRQQGTEEGRRLLHRPIPAAQGWRAARNRGDREGGGGGLIPGLTSGRGDARRRDDGSGRRRVPELGAAALQS